MRMGELIPDPELEKIIQETGAPLEIHCSAACGIPDADALAGDVLAVANVLWRFTYVRRQRNSARLISSSRYGLPTIRSARTASALIEGTCFNKPSMTSAVSSIVSRSGP